MNRDDPADLRWLGIVLMVLSAALVAAAAWALGALVAEAFR